MERKSVKFEDLTIFEERDPRKAVEALVSRLHEYLKNGKVLWLLCGGSNVPHMVSALRQLRESVAEEHFSNLTIGLTDERYGEVNHENSNWKQLLYGGLDVNGVDLLPLLTGKTIEETTSDYAEAIEKMHKEGVTIVAQLGIANDGHLAGVLPHTEGVNDARTACSYTGPDYKRVTLTLEGLKKISTSFSFMYGDAKAAVVERFGELEVSYEDMPSQILKKMPEAIVYTDQPLPDTSM